MDKLLYVVVSFVCLAIFYIWWLRKSNSKQEFLAKELSLTAIIIAILVLAVVVGPERIRSGSYLGLLLCSLVGAWQLLRILLDRGKK